MMFVVAFLAVLACAWAQSPVAPDSGIQCREGWEPGVNSCYKVMKLKVHWIEAWAYCATMRSTLVEIQDQEEQDSIASILQKTPYSTYYEQFWIGLTDMSTEGQLKWARFNTDADYTNFIAGQPDNDHGKGENCVHINAKSHRNFMWNDHSCNAELNFICEDNPLA